MPATFVLGTEEFFVTSGEVRIDRNKLTSEMLERCGLDRKTKNEVAGWIKANTSLIVFGVRHLPGVPPAHRRLCVGQNGTRVAISAALCKFP